MMKLKRFCAEINGIKSTEIFNPFATTKNRQSRKISEFSCKATGKCAVKMRSRRKRESQKPPRKDGFWLVKASKLSLAKNFAYSHSIVAGGLSVTSSTTLLIPSTSSVILLEMRPIAIWERGKHFAVIKFTVLTALIATVYA